MMGGLTPENMWENEKMIAKVKGGVHDEKGWHKEEEKLVCLFSLREH